MHDESDAAAPADAATAAEMPGGSSELDQWMREGADVSPTPIDPERRRRRRRRGWIIAAVVLLVLIGTPAGYAAWALNAPLPATAGSWTPSAPPAGAAASIALPTQGASAVAVAGADDYLGPTASTLFASSGGDDARPMASITKLITALVVLDAHPLSSADDPGPTLTFSASDRALYDQFYVMGATIAPMPRGTSLSLHDSLAAMLIPSASNYAEAIARWAFGSDDAFAEAANSWLQAHGLTHTTVVEPTGNSTRNTSTPSDLLALAKLAAADPTVAKITGTSSVTLPGPGVLYNTNSLLGSHGVTGLKTGTFGVDTYNLLFTASIDAGTGTPLQVTGVILDGATRDSVNASTIGLLDSIRSGFHRVDVAKSGTQIGTYTTAWGSSAKAVMADSAALLTWSNTPIAMTTESTPPTEFTAGAIIGTVTWTAGPQSATAKVRLDGTITPPTGWWRLTHPGELWR